MRTIPPKKLGIHAGSGFHTFSRFFQRLPLLIGSCATNSSYFDLGDVTDVPNGRDIAIHLGLKSQADPVIAVSRHINPAAHRESGADAPAKTHRYGREIRRHQA